MIRMGDTALLQSRPLIWARWLPRRPFLAERHVPPSVSDSLRLPAAAQLQRPRRSQEETDGKAAKAGLANK